jgi:uncharacterized protein
MSLTTRPLTPAPAHDLTDAEFAELDELLAQTPEPLEPLDVVLLDGYLCGVIVQPVLLEPATWLAHVFDFDGRPLPDAVDPAWHHRVTALIARRHGALNRSLAEDGWFDPLVFEVEDDEDDEAGARDDPAAAGMAGDTAGAASAEPAEPSPAPPEPASSTAQADAQPGATPGAGTGAGAGQDPDPAAGVGRISQALMPWVAGFQHATAAFPDLEEIDDDAVATALARLYRHLPAETDEERALVATLDQEFPLTTLDEAIDDMVGAVADLYEFTSEMRYKVDTVRRESPKVGRNDPCPCGSGKKYKQCHGAT